MKDWMIVAPYSRTETTKPMNRAPRVLSKAGSFVGTGNEGGVDAELIVWDYRS
jgi:hypothetical protein